MLQSSTLNPAMLINAFCSSRELTMENFLACREIVLRRLEDSTAETFSVNRTVFTKQEIVSCFAFYAQWPNWKQFEQEFDAWNHEKTAEELNPALKKKPRFKINFMRVLIICIVFTPVVYYRAKLQAERESNKMEIIDVDELRHTLEGLQHSEEILKLQQTSEDSMFFQR